MKGAFVAIGWTLVLQLTLNEYCWGRQVIADPQVYAIELSDSGYSGEGVEWLLQKARGSQYVMFGEQHGVRELGPFIGQVLDGLRGDGFDHLGLELDDWTIQSIEAQGIEPFISKYPNSVAFGYDGELDMLQRAIDANAKLVGLDQMLTAIHPLHRLSVLAESHSQGRLARGAFLKASLKMGEYLREEHWGDIETLRTTFADHASSEAKQILDELELSMRIYTTWRAGQRGEVSKRLAPEMREQMMMDKFDEWASGYSSQSLPSKAIIKMGGAHLLYGIGPNGIPTLGEHIRKQADSLGLGTFAIGIRNFNPESAIVSEEDFGGADALIVDTKRLLNELERDSLVVPKYQNNMLSIRGFDAIVYFRNAGRSEQNVLSGHKRNFRSGLISEIVPIGILFVLCMLSIVPYAILFLQNKAGGIRKVSGFSLASTFFLVTLVAVQLLSIRSVILPTSSLMAASYSILIFIMLIILASIYVGLALKNIKKNEYGLGFRLYYTLMSLCFFALTYYCYHWNIGGMLVP